MTKKLIIIILIALLVASTGVWTYFHLRNTDKIYYWRMVDITRGDVNLIVTATGSLAADTSVDVGVQVSGIIAKINVDFNDSVKKGQVIAILDTTLYYAARLDAQATLHRAEIAATQARKEFERSKNLYINKVEAQADYEVAIAAYQNAKGNIVSMQAQLNKALINLQYCTIKAPIKGMIVARNVQVGNMVIASFNSPVLFTIANNLKKMQVQANVDEADIGQVKIGQLAKFTVDAYPNSVFNGVVTQIRHQPITVLNVVTYVVIIEVANPDLKLMPGLTANANISIQNQQHVLKVATNAFTFIPPLEYIQGAKYLPDSVKKFWVQKLQATSELKKQQIVDQQGTVGYLWAVKDKDVFPILVLKGLNDGSFTEVSGEIQEGYIIATGLNTSAPTTKSAQSPFMPKFPSRKK